MKGIEKDQKYLNESGLKHESYEKNKKKKYETFGWDGFYLIFKFLMRNHFLGLTKKDVKIFHFIKNNMKLK